MSKERIIIDIIVKDEIHEDVKKASVWIDGWVHIHATCRPGDYTHHPGDVTGLC